MLSHRSHRLAASLFATLCILFPGAPAVAQDIKIEKLAEGLVFPEGPVWHPKGFLLFSDVHDSKILKILPQGGTETWFDRGVKTNGLILSIDKKKIYAACHSELELIEIDAETTQSRTLAKDTDGRKFINMNDVAVDTAGHVFFTDPHFGKKSPDAIEGIYRWSPREPRAVLAAPVEGSPNGLVVSPDQKHLYVGRSGGHDVWRYDLSADGQLTSGTKWFDLVAPAAPDGMTVDSRGNLYVTQANDGQLTIISPKAKLIRRIKIFDRMATNCEFEGTNEKILYITGAGTNAQKRTGQVVKLTFPAEIP